MKGGGGKEGEVLLTKYKYVSQMCMILIDFIELAKDDMWLMNRLDDSR